MTWEHLKCYGYAPGHYMSRCHRCNAVKTDMDKRAITCRPCAGAMHAAGVRHDRPHQPGQGNSMTSTTTPAELANRLEQYISQIEFARRQYVLLTVEEAKACLAALTEQPSEPYAWFWRDGSDSGVITTRADYDHHRSAYPHMTFVPVYTHAVQRERAPWNDYNGQPIHHGDRLAHPDGTEFVAVRLQGYEYDSDAWRAIYGTYPESDKPSVSRLCLQIGLKGRAVLRAQAAASSPAVQEPQQPSYDDLVRCLERIKDGSASYDTAFKLSSKILDQVAVRRK